MNKCIARPLVRFQIVSSRSDVVVVGAGVIGCAIAYELASRGASVRIVDDRPAGLGATQASAGILAPYIEARDGGPLLELTARSLQLFDAFVDRVVRDSNIPVKYQRSGTLDVAFHGDAVRMFAATAEMLAGRGIEAHVLEGADARAAEPLLSPAALGGLLIPTHGFVAAAELTNALAAAALARGAIVLLSGRVRKISPSGTDLIVETATESLPAAAVVVAAGSWSGGIAIEQADASLPIKPIRGQLLHLSWCGAAPKRVIWGERCYAVPWGDGTVLVGATVEDVGFDERATVAGILGLLEAACELLPAARDAGLTAVKVGLRPASPDELPLIGRSRLLPNLMYATGHYRNGVLLAPLTAQLVADAVLDGRMDPILELTKPERFGKV
jgi:glycine oxidase